ncbi:MAG: galactokinase family protein [Lachnospiraceae bacterium]|nr:galactokinase family protein [Lachnospiraceae bacterium]
MLTIKALKENLANGIYDANLSRIYCQSIDAMGPYKDRIAHVANGFAQTFGKGEDAEIAIFSAPGRTEIGGNHTDHQRGKVLTGSVNLDALACAAPNGTETVNVFSEGFGMTSMDISSLSIVPEEKNTTASLVRGILNAICEDGHPVAGFDAYIISDVPGGSGLSSSACFEVLIGVIINGLFCNMEVSLPRIARIGQYAENVYFGKPSGLMDQMGCAIGGIITIDFKDAENPVFKAVDFDFAGAGYALCIIDSGADHADLTDDYAAVPMEMKAVAAALGKEVLSEVDEEDFYKAIPQIRANVGDRAILRAIHYYSDCARVDAQVAALMENDFDSFLNLVNASGKSSFTYLQNIATYRNAADQPVGVALAVAEHLLGGKGASRVHGGGFAGTIQAFVPLAKVADFKAGMDALLGEGACKVMYIRPVGGCVIAE